jgi:hypothetical protein
MWSPELNSRQTEQLVTFGSVWGTLSRKIKIAGALRAQGARGKTAQLWVTRVFILRAKDPTELDVCSEPLAVVRRRGRMMEAIAVGWMNDECSFDEQCGDRDGDKGCI